MYKARRKDAYFHAELNKLIQAVENKKAQWISCPCKTCKNLRVFNDTTTIRSQWFCWEFSGMSTLVQICTGGGMNFHNPNLK